MLSPLAKRVARVGVGLSSPRGSLNNSVSSPRNRKALGSKDSPQILHGANDDNSERRLVDKRSVIKTTKAQLPKADLPGHYQLCLKLSTENKITTKNAFELHLIEFMGDMVLVDGKVDFKLAAYTLEAGSKIYVYRVDALHSRVSKCMNSLTIKGAGKEVDEVEDGGAGGGGDGVGEDDAAEAAEATAKKNKEKKARKRKKKKTRLAPGDTKSISVDISSISCQQIDPLFDKFMHMDLSCSENLLLSTLLPLNDTQRFIFNSNDPLPSCGGSGSGGQNGSHPACLAGCKPGGVAKGIAGTGVNGADGPGEADDAELDADKGEVVHELGCPVSSRKHRKLVSIDKLKGPLSEVMKDNKVVCATFRHFEFKNDNFAALDDFSVNKYRFDPNTDAHMSDDDDHHHDQFGGGGGDDDDYEGADYGRELAGMPASANATIHDKSNLLPSTSRTEFQELNKTINSIREGDLSSLKAALVRDKDGGTVFDEDFLKMWSGPNLWKEKHHKKLQGPAALQKKGTKAKRGKEMSLITFDDVVVRNEEEEEEEEDGGKKKKKKRKKIEPEVGSVEWHFQSSNVARLKIEETLQLLPEPHNSSQHSFCSIFIFNDIKLEVMNNSRKKVLEVPGYDYNNINDKLNYCPPATEGNNYDDDNDNVGGFEGADDDDYGGDDVNQNVTLKEDNEPRVFGDDNDFVGGADDDDDEDILTGSRLLPEPEEVVAIKIDYAKSAKNVDVKKMKEKMMSKLNSEAAQEPGTLRKLSSIYKGVTKELSQKEAQNFSVAMAVSCLLQLANENSFNLESDANFEDVVICTQNRTV